MISEPTVAIAGLRVPISLAARLIAALRGIYPNLTEGLGDDDAVRAVLKFWMTSTLTTHEGAMAEAPLADVLEATRAEYQRLADAAREKARADADTIQADPAPTPTTTP